MTNGAQHTASSPICWPSVSPLNVFPARISGETAFPPEPPALLGKPEAAPETARFRRPICSLAPTGRFSGIVDVVPPSVPPACTHRPSACALRGRMLLLGERGILNFTRVPVPSLCLSGLIRYNISVSYWQFCMIRGFESEFSRFRSCSIELRVHKEVVCTQF